MTPKLASAALACAVLALGACLHGCLGQSRLEARGAIARRPLSGSVDSAIARDYLEGRALPDELERTRARWLERGTAPSRHELMQISRSYSHDVAMLLFIETLSAAPENRALRQRFERELDFVHRVGVERARPRVPDDLLVLLVPGWFYATHGRTTGADLARQRDLLAGFDVTHRLVSIDENGTVDDNARAVAAAIRRESARHRILLISASKGGPEVAQALGAELSHHDTRAVVGWLNIGGVVRGTPFADRVLEPDLCWLAEVKLGLEGFDLEGAKSMQTARSRERFASLRLPPRLPVVNYIAAPLSGHISERGRFGFERLRDEGPNDGLTLLVDELVPGASSLLALGVDHYFHHAEQDAWTTALLRVLVEPLT